MVVCAADATLELQGNYFGTAPFLISPAVGLGKYSNVLFQSGCDIFCDDTSGFAAAVTAAQTADATVIIVGLDQLFESEGHDRTDLLLPGNQTQLIQTVAAASK